MAIDALGQLVIGYHTQFSESFRFGALGRTAAELSRDTVQVLGQFDVDESLRVNVRYAGSLLNTAISSRVYALGLLVLQTLDTVSLKTFLRPLRAIQILDDSGITCEATVRALGAAALSITISVVRSAVAACSVIAPEVTFGLLGFDRHIARMHFWWVALRLNTDGLLYANEPYNQMSPFEFRNDFVECCMLDYYEHAPILPRGHFYSLYEQMLHPVGIPDPFTQINLSAGFGISALFLQRTDRSLEQSPFSLQFADKLVECGNHLIAYYGYSKEAITSFMGNDYIGVMNNALFATIYELLKVHDRELKMKSTDLPFDTEEVGDMVYRYRDHYTQVLEKFEALSQRGKEAFQWHLCCDDRVQMRLLTEKTLDLDLIKEIVPIITDLRIELVERGIATHATSVLREAFTHLI